MKKTVKLIVSLCMLIAMLAPITLPIPATVTIAQAATKLKLSDKTLSMEVGETYILKLKGAKKKITWTTGDNEVATVSRSGKVTAVAAGKTKIIASVDGTKYSCIVTVTRPENPYVTNATFDAVEKTLGTVSFVIPSDWGYEETLSMGSKYGASISPKNGLSTLEVQFQKDIINEDVSDELIKKYISTIFTQDFVQNILRDSYPDVVISDFVTSEYSYSGGKAFTYTFTTEVSGIKIRQTAYITFINRTDMFSVIATGVAENIELNTYAEYLLNSVR